jgi:hypothetical protein
MKIRTAFLSLLIPLLLSIKSNSQSSDDFKYLMILNYLHSDSTIIETIKGLYSQVKLISKKTKHVEFNIISRVEFFYLSTFRFHDSLKSSELGIDQNLIDNYKLYRDEFYFTPFESSFLKKVSYSNSSPLFLTFSKPIGNYVIVELCDRKNEPDSIRRFGLTMSILFIFDSTGFIKRISIQSGVYN